MLQLILMKQFNKQSICDYSLLSNKSPKLPTPSNSLMFSQYLNEIPTLSQSTIQDKQRALQAHNFIYVDGDYHNFEVEILKVENLSILYQVTYGYYRTNISIFRGEITIPKIRNYVLGVGGSSQVYLLKTKEKVIAIKSYNTEKMDLYVGDKYLKEVFALKFASALKVGPEFYNICGYDLVRLNNRLEFYMEACYCDDDVKNKGLYKTNLLGNIAVMHHFNCVHCDIKPENIGWSEKQSKYILFDYGYTAFIKQKPGQKSLTKYKGTYHFASKQMQKAFILKEESFVDLYYNDLIGALRSASIPNQRSLMINFNFMEKVEERETFKQGQLIPFFRLCFAIFIKDSQLAENIILSEQKLLLSFRKMIQLNFKEEQKTGKYAQYLKQACQKRYKTSDYERILELENIDSFLYRQLSKQPKNIWDKKTMQINNSTIEILSLMDKINEFWGVQIWVEKLFDYLFDTDAKVDKSRMKAMKTILHQTSKQPTNTQIFFSAVRLFKQYFIETKNIQYLFKIKNIYWIAGHIGPSLQLKYKIWEVMPDINSNIPYFLALYLYFSEFIGFVHYNIGWRYRVLKTHLATNSPQTLYNVCMKILSLLNYQSDIIPNFQIISKIRNLINQLKEFVVEEVQLNLYRNIKQLLECFESQLKGITASEQNDLSKCFLAQKHDENYFFSNEALFISQPVILHLIFLHEQTFSYHFWRNQPDQKKYNRIKNYINDHNFLSQISSIWRLSLLLHNQKYQQARQLFLLSSQSIILINPTFEDFNFLIECLFQMIVSSLPGSEDCFRSFIKLLQQTDINLMLAQIGDSLITLNQLFAKIVLMWKFLSKMKKNQAYFVKFAKFALDMFLDCSRALKMRSQSEKDDYMTLARFIESIHTAILSKIYSLTALNSQDEVKSDIPKALAKLQSSLFIFNSYGIVYELLEILKPYISSQLNLIIQEEQFRFFLSPDLDGDSLLGFRFSFYAVNCLYEYFTRNKMHKESLEFLLGFNRFNKNFTLKSDIVWKFYISAPLENLLDFAVNSLAFEPLIMFDNRPTLIHLLYFIMTKIGDKLPKKIQCRVIRLLAHSNQRNIFNIAHQNRVQALVLRWQRKNKTNYAERTKRINHKIQIRMDRPFQYTKLRRVLNKRIQMSKIDQIAEAGNILKKMIKRDEKYLEKLSAREEGILLKQILDQQYTEKGQDCQ